MIQWRMVETSRHLLEHGGSGTSLSIPPTPLRTWTTPLPPPQLHNRAEQTFTAICTRYKQVHWDCLCVSNNSDPIQVESNRLKGGGGSAVESIPATDGTLSLWPSVTKAILFLTET